LRKGSRKGSKKVARKGSAKGLRKGSRKGSAKGLRKGSRKGSTKGLRKGSRKGSAKGLRKGSRKIGRQMPEAAKRASEAFRGLTKHIVDVMGIKGGPVAMKLASLYNIKAKEKDPNTDPVTTAKKAQEIFDNDSSENRKKLYAKADTLVKEKRAATKAKKAVKKAKAEASTESDSF
jgi:hypothetical protein